MVADNNQKLKWLQGQGTFNYNVGSYNNKYRAFWTSYGGSRGFKSAAYNRYEAVEDLYSSIKETLYYRCNPSGGLMIK